MKSPNENTLFGPDTLVYSYTRKMAIEDGILVDITPMAKEAGFKVPVAVTSALYDGYLTPPESIFTSASQSVEGRTWDLLMIFLISSGHSKQSETRFRVSFVMEDGKDRLQEIKAVIGPGDSGEPVITVMLPEED